MIAERGVLVVCDRGTQHPVMALVETSPMPPPPTAKQQFPRGHGELILLVDDDATVRFVATKVLTTYGYRVLTAENGAEGIATYILRRNEVTLVISDLIMPVMDGPTMIRRLLAVNPEVLIIVASGSLGYADMQFPEAGVRYFLEKPYMTPALLNVVQAALAGVPQPAAFR